MKARHLMNRIVTLMGLALSTGAVAQDPAFVKRGSWVAPPNAGPAGGVILNVKDSFAYVVDGKSGLTVIDVRDPDSPAAIGSYIADDEIRALAISGDHAYLAAGAAGLLIIEISDPTSPSLVGMVDTVALDVGLSGDWAFVTTGDDELLAVDIRDPGNVSWTKLSNFQSRGPEGEGSIAIAGDYAYIFSGPFINVIDVSDPASQQVSPRQVAFWWGHSDLFDDSPGNITDIVIYQDTLFAAAGEGGVLMFDVSDPAELTFQQKLWRNIAGTCRPM